MRHIFLGILLPLLTVILTKVCKAWPAESTDSQPTCNLSAALIGGSVLDGFFFFFLLAGRQLPLRSVHISVVKPSIYMQGAAAVRRRRQDQLDTWKMKRPYSLCAGRRRSGRRKRRGFFFFFLSRWGERYMPPQQAFSFRGGKGAWLICSKIQPRCLEV